MTRMRSSGRFTRVLSRMYSMKTSASLNPVSYLPPGDPLPLGLGRLQGEAHAGDIDVGVVGVRAVAADLVVRPVLDHLDQVGPLQGQGDQSVGAGRELVDHGHPAG